MALVKCKECGAEVSTKAASCPKCGAVRKSSTGFVTKALAWLIGISVVIGIISVATSPHAPSGGSTNATDDLTIAQKAQQDRQRESDARLAERKKQFAQQGGSLIARTKQLNAAGKYADALELGSQWAALDPALDAQTDIARAKVVAQGERAERVRKKKAGVSLGMTKQDVLESSWGKPQSINSTHTAAGARAVGLSRWLPLFR